MEQVIDDVQTVVWLAVVFWICVGIAAIALLVWMTRG